MTRLRQILNNMSDEEIAEALSKTDIALEGGKFKPCSVAKCSMCCNFGCEFLTEGTEGEFYTYLMEEITE